MSGSGHGRYGGYLYGSREEAAQGATPPRRRDADAEGPTEREALGAGLAPAPAHADAYSWDLQLTPGGSYATTAGFQKYAADIAWGSAARLYEERGQLINDDVIADLELDIEGLLLEDPRTQFVSAVAVVRGDNDTILVDVELAVDDDSTHSVVIPVGTP